MNRKAILTLLTLTLLLGFILRFYSLDSIPPGPEWDEASIGYNAFSISQTGRDEWGNKMPLIFPAFGDYKNPLYIYLTAGVVKLWGLNIGTTRFINALSGWLLIVIWFFIAELVFKNKTISILTALFLAVSPFGIFYSRIAGDGIMLSVFLISAGILAELIFIKSRRLLFFITAIILFALSIFSYNLARIISPLLMIIVFGINFNLIKNKLNLIIPLFLILASLFMVYKQSGISVSSRLQYVGIFGDKKGVVLQINEYRDQDHNNFLAKLLHNKATFFGTTLLSNYFAHFSTDFLGNFKDQTNVAESHYPPLYLFQLPFYYFGLILLLRQIKNPGVLLLLILLFIAPLPSIITNGLPSAKRSLVMVGIMGLTSAYGFNYVLRQRKLMVFLSAVGIINILFYFRFFFITYPQQYSHLYARRENAICEIIKKQYGNYDRFIFSRKINGVPYIFPAFCLRFPPEKLAATRRYRLVDGWYYVDSFDKFIFPDETTPDILNRIGKNKIAAFANEEEKNSLVPVISIIPTPVISDQKSALYILSIK